MKILRRRKLLTALDTIKKTVLVRSTSKINYIVLVKYFNKHKKKTFK